MSDKWQADKTDAQRRQGEMCTLHRTVLKADHGTGYVMVACRVGCPEYRTNSTRR